jgi:hypothetical protein
MGYPFIAPNPLQTDNIIDLISAIAGWLFVIAIPVAVGVIIWAGLIFVISRGDQGKITQARKMLLYAVIGLAIIFIGQGFITLIQDILGISVVYATSHVPIDTSSSQGIDFTVQDLADRITFLACWLSRVSITILVIMISFYGIMFMTARGDQTRFDNAKKSFMWGIVGALVILGTYTIIATVANAVGASVSLIPLVCS